MKVGILYDSSEPEARVLHDAIRSEAEKMTADVLSIDTASDKAAPCIGCFGCWIRTPGVCVLRNDGGTDLVAKIWDADYLVFVSRITWGGYSARVKSYADRILPVLHPYFRKVNGEMHHRLRYGKLPVFLAAGYGAKTEAEEETFFEYAASHRDQGGITRASGTFIARRSGDEKSNASACAAWCAKEIAK